MPHKPSSNLKRKATKPPSVRLKKPWYELKKPKVLSQQPSIRSSECSRKTNAVLDAPDLALEVADADHAQDLVLGEDLAQDTVLEDDPHQDPKDRAREIAEDVPNRDLADVLDRDRETHAQSVLDLVSRDQSLDPDTKKTDIAQKREIRELSREIKIVVGDLHEIRIKTDLGVREIKTGNQRIENARKRRKRLKMLTKRAALITMIKIESTQGLAADTDRNLLRESHHIRGVHVLGEVEGDHRLLK